VYIEKNSLMAGQLTHKEAGYVLTIIRSPRPPSLPPSLPPLLPFLRFPTGIARAFPRPADRDHSRDGEQGDGNVEVGREGGRDRSLGMGKHLYSHKCINQHRARRRGEATRRVVPDEVLLAPLKETSTSRASSNHPSSLPPSFSSQGKTTRRSNKKSSTRRGASCFLGRNSTSRAFAWWAGRLLCCH